jgi:hypothetical protein
MTPEQRHESITTINSMERHDLMYRISANNPDKGKPGGDCNITQCQRPGASSYNGGMHAFYCRSCASDIKAHSNGLFEVSVLPDKTYELGDNPRHEVHLPTDILDPDGRPPRIKHSQQKPSRHYGLGEPNKPFVRVVPKVGRNQYCPCGSNLKYKHCCVGL